MKNNFKKSKIKKKLKKVCLLLTSGDDKKLLRTFEYAKGTVGEDYLVPLLKI